MREHQPRLGTRLERTLDKFDIFTYNISLNVFTTVHYESNLTKYSTECRQTFHGMSVLLKEMRARGQSKISSCCFCVWCKSKELGGRVGVGGPRFPCVTRVVESFSLDILRAIISYLQSRI